MPFTIKNSPRISQPKRKTNKANYKDTRCCDCQIETNHHELPPNINRAEWYMVHDHIWEQATKDKSAFFLCIGCLEKRLDRTLTPADFNDAPLNYWPGFQRSPRLRNRLGIRHT